MDFKNIPEEKKIQFARLMGGMSRSVLQFLFALFALGLIVSIDYLVPASSTFTVVEEVIPDLPWDYNVFMDVDVDRPATNELVSYGRRLIMETADYIGPKSSKPFAGNNLDCNSCHLDGGTKPFAAPFVTVPSQFPQFRGRENKEGTLFERINGCMQRYMNGLPLPEDSKEL